jgi:hypothetical protein
MRSRRGEARGLNQTSPLQERHRQAAGEGVTGSGRILDLDRHRDHVNGPVLLDQNAPCWCNAGSRNNLQPRYVLWSEMRLNGASCAAR